MKKTVLLSVLLLMAGLIYAQGPSPTYNLSSTHGWIQTKNYQLLTLLQEDAAATSLLNSDADLAKLGKAKIAAITTTLDCKDVNCFLDNAKFSDADIQLVSARLRALYKPTNALGLLVKTKLIPSGMYYMLKDLPAADMLAKAWEQDIAGVNYTIDVYAGGKKPNYPAIDSISFDVKNKRYPVLLYDAAAVLAEDAKSDKLFFEPAMQAALEYLEINGRKDPANYEPMRQTVNKPAADAVKITKWATYPYSVILVPGAGADDLVTEITPEGMLRCRLAAQQYLKHQAPFIIVSGGKVHPYKTKYCEAEEMKRFLVETMHIPASAVIMEPHARHTTTNMRNGARLMFRYGMPMDKPGVVITDRSQTNGIINMAARCMRELKYVPYKLGKHLSDTEVEFYPLVDAMQINPYEPLDP